MYRFKQKGIERKGKINYHEKNHNTKTEIIELDKENEQALMGVLQEIEALINMSKPPTPKFENKCKKCAYYEYCFI